MGELECAGVTGCHLPLQFWVSRGKSVAARRRRMCFSLLLFIFYCQCCLGGLGEGMGALFILVQSTGSVPDKVDL